MNIGRGTYLIPYVVGLLPEGCRRLLASGNHLSFTLTFHATVSTVSTPLSDLLGVWRLRKRGEYGIANYQPGNIPLRDMEYSL